MTFKASSLFDPTRFNTVLEKPVLAYLKGGSIPGVRGRDGYPVTNSSRVASETFLITGGRRYDEYTVLNVFASTGPSSHYTPHDLDLTPVEDADGSKKKKIFDDIEKWNGENLSFLLGHGFWIGSDPEAFVVDENQQLIPAFDFLPGKENPVFTPGSDADGTFGRQGNTPAYYDGYQAEFATKAGACLEYHTDSVAAGLRCLYDNARKKFPDAKLTIRSVFNIDPDRLQNDAEEFVAFGCMPSYNAYGIKVDMPPCREVPFRSAGGHIHFGIGLTTHEQAQPIVKALDTILGVACVSFFGSFDSPTRRVLYGLPGEYRLPPHGMEYRPLSNAWLSHPVIMNLVFDLARRIVVMGQKGFMKYWKSSEEETLNTIITCDVAAARKSLELNKDVMMSLFKASYGGWASKRDLEMFFNFFMNGIESVVKDPNDFVTNWNLEGEWQARCRGKNVLGMIDCMRAGKKVA